MPALSRRLASGVTTVGLVLTGMAVAAPAASADPTPSCGGNMCSVSYETPGTYTVTVPGWVTSVDAYVAGAQGGDGQGGAEGGHGGFLIETFGVTPGEKLTVEVGAQGTAGGARTIGGGGAGFGAGASGGGASSVRRADGTVLGVAGGGGGAGDGDNGGGGAGSGEAGETGQTGQNPTGIDRAIGGSPTAGGAGASSPAGQGAAGAARAGGDGLSGSPSGGGGGGWFGGGGGAASSGAGGSGFAAAGVTVSHSSVAYNDLDGTVGFNWAALPSKTVLSASPASGTPSDGSITFSAKAVDGSGNPLSGPVDFYLPAVPVDMYDPGTPTYLCRGVMPGHDGTATCAASLQSGTYTVVAEYPGDDKHGTSTDQISYVVDRRAVSHTQLAISATKLTATVTGSATSPSGSVAFADGASSLGSAPLVNGVATLNKTLTTGTTHDISATYSGDATYLTSHASGDRQDPKITASASGTKSSFGWYRSTVTVSFACTRTSAPVTCPAPVVLGESDREAQSVTRTATANDGGKASVTFGGIRIDLGAPKVWIDGPVAGRSYETYQVPDAKCRTQETYSGLDGACKLTRTIDGNKVTFTAVARDKAGNVTTDVVRVYRK